MYWLQQASVRGLGYSYAVSSGNELDLDLADLIDFLIEDENTRVITSMVERAPPGLRGARRCGAKPIILMRLGGEEASLPKNAWAWRGNGFRCLCENRHRSLPAAR
jgi:acyl-CoA synthetase (NDP forming)